MEEHNIDSKVSSKRFESDVDKAVFIHSVCNDCSYSEFLGHPHCYACDYFEELEEMVDYG